MICRNTEGFGKYLEDADFAILYFKIAVQGDDSQIQEESENTSMILETSTQGGSLRVSKSEKEETNSKAINDLESKVRELQTERDSF
jgi:hypothetical protein